MLTSPADRGLERPRQAPLVMATMASQALLVVLSPTLAAVGRDFSASDGLVGQARSVTAAVAVVASLLLASRVERLGVRRLLRAGGALAVAGSAVVAASPSLPAFLAAHAVVAVAFACLLTGGFAGVAAFGGAERAAALGRVAGANALAWILVSPAVGAITEWAGWRLAHVVPAAIGLASLAAARSAAAIPADPVPPRLAAVLGHGPARRWITAETVAYAAWTALLTFIGAYLVGRVGTGAAAAGWWLALGAGAYFLAASGSGALLGRVKTRRTLVAACSAGMAVLLGIQFATESLPAVVAVFCATGLVAGIRTPTSGGLGLGLLPGHPGVIMSARTAATQLGYLLGALVGGLLIATAGYAAMGVALAAGMAASALLFLRVEDG